MIKAKSDKYADMTTSPIPRLITRMAIPTIVSMVISALYNMVDTLYIGHMEESQATSATAAIGVIFAFMAILQAVGFFFGHGSGNPMSRALGQRDTEEAGKYASAGFFSALAAGVALMIVGLTAATPVARLFGATETILPHAVGYLRIIAIGAPYIVVSFVLNNQLRLQGNALYAMFGIGLGALLNIALDPLFIFTFRMGVEGAALATILSQAAGFVVLLAGTFRKGCIRISWKAFRLDAKRFRAIFACGLPAFCRQALASVATICLNNLAKGYGDPAVAAFSVVNRVTMFAYSVVLGYGQGFQPVCGFNFGAGFYNRVRKAFWFSVLVGTCVCIVAAALGAAVAPGIVALFRGGDAEVVSIGARLLRAQCVSFPLLGFVTLSNMILQNVGATVRGSVLSAARQGLFFLPILYIGALCFGFGGLVWSQAIADVLTFLIAIPFMIPLLNRLKREDRVAESDGIAGDRTEPCGALQETEKRVLKDASVSETDECDPQEKEEERFLKAASVTETVESDPRETEEEHGRIG